MEWDERDPLETRASLLARMKNLEDDDSWQEFFDTYWKLFYGVARKHGLSETEAQDVVQEVMMSVFKSFPKFEYDPNRSFKAWLLQLTRWRIADQARKRPPAQAEFPPDTGGQTATQIVHAIADPVSLLTDEAWEIDWQKHLLSVAMDNVRKRADPLKFQLFQYYVNKEWPPAKVAERFKVPIEQVYTAKYRVTELLKDEVDRLERLRGTGSRGIV